VKISHRIASIANKILMGFVIGFALLLLSYSLYVLYDIMYTGRNAFVSYDMLRYRPVPADSAEDDTENRFSELKEINPDAVGWLEIFGTNINYPIVQGRDDLEYSGKDIYGKNSLTGSIYLSCENDNTFNDWYNLIYGHHMDNGAMFGDIEKFISPEYFFSHTDGLLQTTEGDYSLKIFACVLTDSYEGKIYTVADRDRSTYPELMAYIKEYSVNVLETLSKEEYKGRIIAMSTCADAVTNGRMVLFAEVSDYVPRALQNTVNSGNIKQLDAVGHLSESNHWAFLNLVCVLLIFFLFVPLFYTGKKYRQLPYARKKIKEFEEKLEIYDDADREFADAIISDLKEFIRKIVFGTVVEVLLLIVSAVLFLITENLSKPVVMRDRWTGLMILILSCVWIVDFICFRYRGERPDDDDGDDFDIYLEESPDENEQKKLKTL